MMLIIPYDSKKCLQMFTRLFHLQMAVFYHQFDKIMNLCKHRLASQGSYAYTITVVYVYCIPSWKQQYLCIDAGNEKIKKIFDDFHHQLSKGADIRWAPSKYIV